MFNVKDYAGSDPEIAAKMINGTKHVETEAAQKHLLEAWERNKASLHAFMRKPLREIEDFQLKRIGEIVDRAVETHPYYKKVYTAHGYRPGTMTWDIYNRLPTMSKQDILDNPGLFSHPGLSPKAQDSYAYKSSGSSGQVLTVMFDPAGVERDVMHCMRFYEQMLGRERKPDEWLYQIYVAAPPFTALDGKYPIFTVSNECAPEAVLAHLKELKPVILSGLPSFLERLSELDFDPADLGIRAVSTNSEASTVAQRQKIGNKFGLPVHDEYSSIELALIATQCAQGAYHLVEDNVRVDVVDPDTDGVGKVVATSLINEYMPLIRYSQGDTATISGAFNCACGNTHRHLSSFQGRVDESLKDEGRLVRPDLVMALYDRAFLSAGNNIGGFHIRQTEMDEVRVMVVPADKSRPVEREIVDKFCKGLKSLFTNAALRVVSEERDALPENGKSYKRRLIKCDV